jgi:hypothetical protein
MGKSNFVVIEGIKGKPCPKCGQRMEVREHREITPKLLAKAYYFRRWHACSRRCGCVHHFEKYKVWKEPPKPKVSAFDLWRKSRG